MIPAEDMEYLRSVFITRDSCDNKMGLQNDKLDKLSMEMQELSAVHRVTNKLLWGVISALIPIVIKLLFGM